MTRPILSSRPTSTSAYLRQNASSKRDQRWAERQDRKARIERTHPLDCNEDDSRSLMANCIINVVSVMILPGICVYKALALLPKKLVIGGILSVMCLGTAAKTLIKTHNTTSQSDAPEPETSPPEIPPMPAPLIGGMPVSQNITNTSTVAVSVDLGGEIFDCSGVMIAEDTVLTAQHCLLDMSGPSGFEIKFDGNTSLYNDEVSGSGDRTFDDIEMSGNAAGSGDGTFDNNNGSRDNVDDYGDYTEEPLIPAPPENITISFGLTTAELAKRDNQYKVKTVHLLPNYGTQSPQNDLAILKLERPIKGAKIERLPTFEEHKSMRTEFANLDKQYKGDPKKSLPRNLILKGWGVKENPDKTSPLIDDEGSVSLNIFDSDNYLPTDKLLGTRKTARGYSEDLSKSDCQTSLICSKSNKTDICGGDSGGPALWSKNGTEPPVLVGIASKGSTGCLMFDSSSHVDIHHHQDWIKSHQEILQNKATDDDFTLEENKQTVYSSSNSIHSEGVWKRLSSLIKK